MMVDTGMLDIIRMVSFGICICLLVGSTIYFGILARTVPFLYFSYWILILTTVYYGLIFAAIIRVKLGYEVKDGPSPLYLWKWATVLQSFCMIGVLTVCFIWWAKESEEVLKLKIGQSHYMMAVILNNVPFMLLLVDTCLNRLMPNMFLTILTMAVYMIVSFVSLSYQKHLNLHRKLTP